MRTLREVNVLERLTDGSPSRTECARIPGYRPYNERVPEGPFGYESNLASEAMARDDADAFMTILDDIGRDSKMLLGGSIARWAADMKRPKILDRLLAEGMSDPILTVDQLRERALSKA